MVNIYYWKLPALFYKINDTDILKKINYKKEHSLSVHLYDINKLAATWN
jgi:hypothetical protein